jgi:hypothetical protein
MGDGLPRAAGRGQEHVAIDYGRDSEKLLFIVDDVTVKKRSYLGDAR